MQRKALVGCGILVLVPVLLLFGIRAYLSRDLRAAASEYDRALAAAKEAGLAIRIEDALPKPVPETENAAKEYRALVALDHERRKEFGSAFTTFANLGEPSKNVPTSELRAAIQKVEPFLAILRRAANKPYCVFDRDWSKPYAVVLPEYALMRQAGRALVGAGWMAIREGRLSDGLTDLGLALKVSRHAATEPTMISLLVSVAIEDVVLRAVTQMAAERPALASDPEFRAFVGQARPLPDLKNAFAGELAFTLSLDLGDDDVLKMTQDGFGDSGPEKNLRYVADTPTLNRAVHARSLQFWTQTAAILRGIDSVAVYREMADLSARYSQRGEQRDNLSYRLLNVMLPTLDGVAALPVWCQAQRKMAGLYLDILAYRSANRGWPADLSRLGRNATDPWSGRPLVYRVTTDGFDLYSVGPNLQDDAGSPDDRGYFYPLGSRRTAKP